MFLLSLIRWLIRVSHSVPIDFIVADNGQCKGTGKYPFAAVSMIALLLWEFYPQMPMDTGMSQLDINILNPSLICSLQQITFQRRYGT